MNTIFGDIRYILADKLECKDLWNLGKIQNKERMIDLIVKKGEKEIKTRLQRFLGDKYEQFMEIMNRTGCVIAGSFVLQCLLNEDWESDIDIFVPIEEKILERTDCYNPVSEIETFLFQNYKMDNYHAAERYGHDIHENKIKWIRTFERKNNHNFQVVLVEVKTGNIKDFIHENFDFDIVKNVFQEEILHIFDYEQVFSKKVEFKVGRRLGSSILRTEKYEKRGFTFFNKQMSEKRICELVEHQDYGIVSGDCGNMYTNFLKCGKECLIKFCFGDTVKHLHVNLDKHPAFQQELIILPSTFSINVTSNITSVRKCN